MTGSSPTPERTEPVPEHYINRELSWLDFNDRVLALAEDQDAPLLERAKFLAIFSQNLDEFFQVRVSGLQELLRAGIRKATPDGMDPLDQLRAIADRVDEMVNRQAAVFTKEIAPALEEVGIRFCNWDELDDDDREYLVRVFEEQVFPVLTPLAVDPAHPFPFISNLSLNLAVVVRDPEGVEGGEQHFARVKVPALLPRFVELSDHERFVPIEQVIAARMDALFPGMEIVEQYVFRVTRDQDYELSDESEDLLEAVESVLRQQSKSGHVVRLEVEAHMSDGVVQLLRRELGLSDLDVTVIDGTLDLSGLWAVHGLPRPDLKDEPVTPQTQPALARTEMPSNIFTVLTAGDVLVQHPYDSYATSVEAFIDQAARDPKVLAIKQTIYRTAGKESALVRSLMAAAAAGKQVVALVELQARFDEEANIERAHLLEEAGVHVVYGLVGLKTHCKILLVVRQEEDGIHRYFHIGTGNYNSTTATLYEDIGVLSADPDLGADLTELFNALTGYSRQGDYRKLLVAPHGLRSEIQRRINAEADKGPNGLITLKMNSLVDPKVIEALYAASRRGCRIELLVRGICCLRPGVAGLSDTIRVRSLIGRFLEHSRIYRFGADPATAEYLIGSADLMPRNLDRRIEALTPISDPRLRSRLAQVFEIELSDDVLAWELGPDGDWHKVATVAGVNSHRRLQELAVERSHENRDVRA